MMTTTTFKAPDDPDLIYVQNRDIDISVINEYAEMMKTGIEFDACSGIIDSEGKIYVWDGNHRGQAAIRAGKSIRITLEDGTREGAEWMALSANTKHGLRRSRKDKQRIIHDALKHRHSTHRSNREIARHCGVDHKTIGKIRADLVASGEIPQIAERTVTRNGTEYQQAAKAEPAYAAVWQLEEGVKSWLEKALHSANATKISVLTEIKKKTASGKRNLERLITGDIILPSPRRKRDVVQAVNNVLNQLQQAAKAEPQYIPIWQLEQATQMWLQKKWTTPELRMKALFNIKQGNQDLLDELYEYQRTPHRKSDVKQAANNVLDQMNQERVKTYKEAKTEPTKPNTDCAKCGQPGEVFYKQLWKCKSCYIEIQEAAAKIERNKAVCEETFDHTVPTLYCSKCDKETWQKNPPDNPKKILCWHCSPKKAKMIAEDEAKQAERTAELERKNAEAMARIKAYKTQVAREATTPCLACAPTFNPAAWAKDRTQDICPDCLRALGKAMIEAANEIKIQN